MGVGSGVAVGVAVDVGSGVGVAVGVAVDVVVVIVGAGAGASVSVGAAVCCICVADGVAVGVGVSVAVAVVVVGESATSSPPEQPARGARTTSNTSKTDLFRTIASYRSRVLIISFLLEYFTYIMLVERSSVLSKDSSLNTQ